MDAKENKWPGTGSGFGGHQEISPEIRRILCLHWLLCGVALLLSFIFLACSYHTPILDGHAFRQTQTAITSLWMLKSGFRLDYLTPVAGSPWSIPFEFPLYQALVALLAQASGLALDFSGRLLGWVMMVATLLPVAACMRVAGLDRRALPLVSAFYLATPVYFFWGSTFLIESTALFLCTCFLYYALKAVLHTVTWKDVLPAAIFFLLVLLQKSTTVLPLLPVLLGCFLLRLRRDGLATLTPAFLVFALCLVLDMAAYLQWVRHTDQIKEGSVIGHYLTSGALSAWNFGTLAQRFSWALWGQVLAGRILAPYLLGYVFWLGWKRQDIRQDRALVAVLLTLAAMVLAHLLIFTNLQIHHDYYQYSVCLYVAVATGLICSRLALRPLARIDHRMPWLVLTCLLLFCLAAVKERFLAYHMENARTLQLARYIDSVTPQEAPIIILGDDWSAQIAYYAQRKAATVPEWDDLPRRAVLTPALFVDRPPAAYIVCEVPESAFIAKALKARAYHQGNLIYGCPVFLPAVSR
jgi:hypothetical protein